MIETQQSISDWANETFGPSGSNARVAARANEEMAELLRALTAEDAHPKAAEEVADIVIILYRLATRLGILYEASDNLVISNEAELEDLRLEVAGFRNCHPDHMADIAALEAELKTAREALVYYSEICDCKPNPVSEPHDEHCHLQRARQALEKINGTSS